MGSEPGWRISLSTDSSYFTEKYPSDQEDECNPSYPKYSVDERMNLSETHSVYIRYRIAGGKMKWKETDTGEEELYKQWPGIELIEGDWNTDYNNIAPCEWTNSDSDYVRYGGTSRHIPKPSTCMKQRATGWTDVNN